MEDVDGLVASLREEGSDTARIEVKTARGGYPGDLLQTMSAFANTPGGGIILLGLAEGAGFSAVGVYDAADAQARLASQARQALEPPVQVHVDSRDFEGARIVVARIVEAAPSAKPCRVKSNGKAYLRAYDGDYEMSELEAQGFIANRDHARFDRRPLPDATARDLSPELVEAYLAICRQESSTLARLDADEVLARTGVVTREGALTLAGALVLGSYPQEFLPNLVVQASVAPRPGDPPGTRASDVRKFDGPIPVILDEASAWVRRNTKTRVRFGPDGHGRDEPEYPSDAVRELLSNALIHRDLGPHAMAYPISLTLEHNQLVLSNPGGLWGITVDRLGREPVSSARNDVLLRVAQNARTTGGRRVVEGIATGIPTVLRSLRDAGMVEPSFFDQGVRFTVRVPNHALLGRDDIIWLHTATAGRALTDAQKHALVAMRHGRTWTNSSYRAEFPRDSRDARTELQGLVDAGLAVARGERGGRTYSIVPEHAGAPTVDLFTELPQISDEHRGPRRRTGGAREDNAAQIMRELTTGPATFAALISRTGLSRRQVEYAMGLLRVRGDVVLEGSQGKRGALYRRVDRDDHQEAP